MAKQPLNGVLQYLRTAAAVHTNRELPDRDLLDRFVSACDEGAFTVLIERHGPMVLGVCRRALPNFHDAEDACQATFLVLARKAASVRKKTSLSNWLHGVACRAAANLKRDHARRRTRERGVDPPAPKDPAAEVSWREVQAILDEELQRLPARYRAPMILCYLDGMTRDEAARRLGVSPTTLHGRLERARGLLRQYLTKRNLTLGSAMSAAVLAESVAQAALAPTFVVSSTKAAMLLAAGRAFTHGVVATHVLALTQEVLKTMFLTKLKLGTAAVLCAVLFVGVVGGLFTSAGLAQNAPRDDHVVPSQIPDNDVNSAKPKQHENVLPSQQTESDLDFIRRVSKDLRGIEPTLTEIHFFVASNDQGRRQKLIDLFIQERQAEKAARQLAARIDSIIQKRWADNAISDADFMRRRGLDLTGTAPSPAEIDRFLKSKDPNKRAKLINQLLERDDYAKRWADHFGIVTTHQTNTGLGTLQRKFYTEVLAAANKGDVARITQAYLDGMIDYVTTNPKSQDVPDAMRQIIFVYESQGKIVEAGAWRDKLLQQHLTTPTDEEFLNKAFRLARLPTELVAAKRTDGEMIDALYKATLARLPTDAEKVFAMKHLQSGKDCRKLCRDLLWALVNTNEFMELHSLRVGSDRTTQFHDVLTKTWNK
jgi:RNA polymerase sigma factor (sigma-70 family)